MDSRDLFGKLFPLKHTRRVHREHRLPSDGCPEEEEAEMAAKGRQEWEIPEPAADSSWILVVIVWGPAVGDELPVWRVEQLIQTPKIQFKRLP